MTNITTVAGRKALAARREPYWRKIEKGRAVGYRAGAGTWIARHTNASQEKAYQALDVTKPDAADAYDNAKKLAEEWFDSLTGGATPHYLIDDAIADYIDDRRLHKGEDSARAAREVLHKSVLGKFKGREVSSLTTAELKRWRNAPVPRELKPEQAEGLNAEQRRELLQELQRRAKDTANRHWATFRAALSLAFKDGKVASDVEWRRVKPFEDVGRERDFYPTPEQVKAVLDGCHDAFRPLAQAAALTGFRLLPLITAKVADFDSKDGSLHIRRDKKHERVATLSSAAVELFKRQCKAKLPGAYIFVRGDGLPWGKSHHHRPFREACAKAKVPREFIFYSLRHYYISRALLAGMNVHALAKNVGTSAKMIEKHYGKFIRTDVRDMLDRVEVAG